jgi:hypothetical protein
MTIASPEEFTAAASGAMELPGPDTVIGLPQVPAAVALVAAWISGFGLLDIQTASCAPLGATAKYTWLTFVSLPDRTTGDDHVLLLMVALTASACDVG